MATGRSFLTGNVAIRRASVACLSKSPVSCPAGARRDNSGGDGFMRVRASLCVANALVALWIVRAQPGVVHAAQFERIGVARAMAYPHGRTVARDDGAPIARAPMSARTVSEEERTLLELTNEDRARFGLAPL